MKELKLLPEDWKGEIDYPNADVLITKLGSVFIAARKQIYTASVAEFFNQKGDICVFEGYSPVAFCYTKSVNGLIDMQPEPRPIDSIKLSECCFNHVVISENKHGETFRSFITVTEGVRTWNVSNLKTRLHWNSDSLDSIQGHTGIKIYDMTQ